MISSMFMSLSLVINSVKQIFVVIYLEAVITQDNKSFKCDV